MLIRERRDRERKSIMRVIHCLFQAGQKTEVTDLAARVTGAYFDPSVSIQINLKTLFMSISVLKQGLFLQFYWYFFYFKPISLTAFDVWYIFIYHDCGFIDLMFCSRISRHF